AGHVSGPARGADASGCAIADALRGDPHLHARLADVGDVADALHRHRRTVGGHGPVHPDGARGAVVHALHFGLYRAARDVERAHRAVALGEPADHLLGAVLRHVGLGHADGVAFGEAAAEDLLHVLLGRFRHARHVELEQLDRHAVLPGARLDHVRSFGGQFLVADVAVGIGIAAAGGQQDRRGKRRGVDQAHRGPLSQAALGRVTPPRYQARAVLPTTARAPEAPRPNAGQPCIALRSPVRHMSRMAELVIRRGLEEPDTSGTFTPHKPQRPEKALGGRRFRIVSDYQPAGDQPTAIAELVAAAREGERTQVLLGVTGSGKTFTMAKVIEELQRPALVLAPNKILAAQLYGEFKSFFPENAVEYFVSYYDYYQPEASVPRSDTYIEKESSVNEAIDRMRHAATRALLERDDVIIVASVSCLYGIGSLET